MHLKLMHNIPFIVKLEQECILNNISARYEDLKLQRNSKTILFVVKRKSKNKGE